MITIYQPTIKETENKSILTVDIDLNGEKKKIWFSVEKKYGKYLCHERSDAFVVALILYAMKHKQDITCIAPISEYLYYQIETYLIPALYNNCKTLHCSKIIAPIEHNAMSSEHAVGTGISGGIDSLTTIIEHMNTKFADHNITHLMFNNVGSHGNGEKGRELYNIRLERIRSYCTEYNFNLIETDSNLNEEIPQNHLLTNTYVNMFAVYALQKLYSIYYYSSVGYSYSGCSLKNHAKYDSANYDMFSLSMLSTDSLKLYSSGSMLSRFEKTKLVANYKPSYKYLDVCGQHPYSCGHCSKCIQIMFALDIIGKLDFYKDIFDVKAFRQHHNEYLAMFYAYYKAKKDFFDQLYKYVEKDITLNIKLKALWMYRKHIYQKFFPKK